MAPTSRSWSLTVRLVFIGLRLHRRRAGSAGGFTLLELMIVTLIAGLLASIALPSFLQHANRAKEAQAMNYIGAMNRAQQGYFYENSRFASSLDALGFSHITNADSYDYTLALETAPAQVMNVEARPREGTLQGYVGLVYTTVDIGNNITISSLVCALDGATAPTVMTGANGMVEVVNCQG